MRLMFREGQRGQDHQAGGGSQAALCVARSRRAGARGRACVGNDGEGEIRAVRRRLPVEVAVLCLYATPKAANS